MILRFYRRKGFQRVEVSELPEDLVTGTNSWAPVAETLVRSMWDENPLGFQQVSHRSGSASDGPLGGHPVFG